MYLLFVVDAAVTCAWQQYPQTKLDLSVGFPIYTSAIFMETGTHVVTLVSPPSTAATEGQTFDQQPTLRVLDQDGNPVSGVGCIATIDTRNGKRYPAGYMLGKNASTDKLLNRPVAADYYRDNMVNLGNATQMAARTTGEDGYITFSGLGFATFGALRNASATYELAFRCGSGRTNASLAPVTVSTSVSSIEILYVSSNSIVSSLDSTYDLIVTAYVLDSEGKGIPGKLMTGAYVFEGVALIV